MLDTHRRPKPHFALFYGLQIRGYVGCAALAVYVIDGDPCAADTRTLNPSSVSALVSLPVGLPLDAAQSTMNTPGSVSVSVGIDTSAPVVVLAAGENVQVGVPTFHRS